MFWFEGWRLIEGKKGASSIVRRVYKEVNSKRAAGIVSLHRCA
jgi:hypothetical protein